MSCSKAGRSDFSVNHLTSCSLNFLRDKWLCLFLSMVSFVTTPPNESDAPLLRHESSSYVLKDLDENGETFEQFDVGTLQFFDRCFRVNVYKFQVGRGRNQSYLNARCVAGRNGRGRLSLFVVQAFTSTFVDSHRSFLPLLIRLRVRTIPSVVHVVTQVDERHLKRCTPVIKNSCLLTR